MYIYRERRLYSYVLIQLEHFYILSTFEIHFINIIERRK